MRRLSRGFFNRNTLVVAKELLGKYLVRRVDGKVIAARITETEAYCGQNDLACHASKGLTERTKVMFGPPGHAYIYLIYGMYHCLNVVTEEKGYPAAVLIRSCVWFKSKTQNTDVHKTQIKAKNTKPKNPNVCAFCGFKLNGPGKLCRELKIDKKLNGVDLCNSKDLWLEDRGEKSPEIKKGKRINIGYAGEYKDKLWRFFLD